MAIYRKYFDLDKMNLNYKAETDQDVWYVWNDNVTKWFRISKIHNSYGLEIENTPDKPDERAFYTMWLGNEGSLEQAVFKALKWK